MSLSSPLATQIWSDTQAELHETCLHGSQVGVRVILPFCPSHSNWFDRVGMLPPHPQVSIGTWKIAEPRRSSNLAPSLPARRARSSSSESTGGGDSGTLGGRIQPIGDSAISPSSTKNLIYQEPEELLERSFSLERLAESLGILGDRKRSFASDDRGWDSSSGNRSRCRSPSGVISTS